MIRCELSSHWQERQICSERFVSAAIHNADAAFLLDLPNYRAGRGCVTWFKDTYLNTVVQEIGTEIWKQQIVPLVTLYQDKVLPLVNLPASLCLLRDLTLVIPCQLLYSLSLLLKPENMGKFELKYSLKSVMEVVVWKKGKHGDYLYYVNYKNVLMESLWNTLCCIFGPRIYKQMWGCFSDSCSLRRNSKTKIWEKRERRELLHFHKLYFKLKLQQRWMGPCSPRTSGHAAVRVCSLYRFEQFWVDSKLYVEVIMSWWFYGKSSKWTAPQGVA